MAGDQPDAERCRAFHRSRKHVDPRDCTSGADRDPHKENPK